MTQGNGHPTETSPLLAKDQPQVQAIEPGEGIAPDAGVANGAAESSASAYEDGGEVERQVSGLDRQKQYEGMPEVKEKMKYM